MALPKYDAKEMEQGVLDKVVGALSVMLESHEAVDVVTFAESPDFLGLTLYPRQRLILKLYYRLPLTSYPCWCKTRGKADPEAACEQCFDTGVYDELADVKYLLSCQDKYAKMYFPGLCQHHITGSCEKPICQGAGLTGTDAETALADYRVLSDAELTRRLSMHRAHILDCIAGRRGSKSALGAVVNAYSLYLLLRMPDPHKELGIIRVPIGTANVATDEDQAKILLNQMKALLERSPWYSRLSFRPLDVLVEFTGRNIYRRSYHSNSSSVRGQTLMAIFLDEFCHFNKTNGKLSDKAMKAALFPSVITFGMLKRIVITSSPLNKAGVAWELFESAMKRISNAVIAVQLATWYMNPTCPRSDSEVDNAYRTDPEYAEVEYGAQWSESVGVFIPPEAVDACVNRLWTRQQHGRKGVKYSLHVDLSRKRDRSGLVVTHYDKDIQKVRTDRVEQFDPEDVTGDWTNALGEIDHERVFSYICELHDTYGFKFQSITFDQFNSQWLLQALRKKFNDPEGKWILELTVTEKLNREMYGNLRSLITQGGIEYYAHTNLIKELKLLAKTVKPSGAFKVEAPPGEHDDLADALAASALMCLVLALGLTSSIVVVRETVAERQKKTLASEFAGVRHLKECTETDCTWGCPVARKRQEAELGVQHDKACTTSYCVWNCAVARKLQE